MIDARLVSRANRILVARDGCPHPFDADGNLIVGDVGLHLILIPGFLPNLLFLDEAGVSSAACPWICCSTGTNATVGTGFPSGIRSSARPTRFWTHAGSTCSKRRSSPTGRCVARADRVASRVIRPRRIRGIRLGGSSDGHHAKKGHMDDSSIWPDAPLFPVPARCV